MSSRLPLLAALCFVGCGRVTFGGATDDLDAGLIAIGVATDAAHDTRAPGEVTDGRGTDSGTGGAPGIGGAPGAGGAPAMPPPMGGAGGAAVMPPPMGGAAGTPGCQ